MLRGSLVTQLSTAGFVAADEEAEELIARAAGDRDLLVSLLARRLTGEPLAWITESASFCGMKVRVDPGVYVPRWQSEPLARRAADRLPPDGVAIDLCCGSGAIARFLSTTRPGARVVGCDIDERAVACAAVNGVQAHRGDMFDPLPAELKGVVDVVVGVVPYVPTAALPLLPTGTLAFEPRTSYDGGDDGTGFLRLAVEGSRRFLRDEGTLLLELGGDQAKVLSELLERHGYVDVEVLEDDEGDVRGIEAKLDGVGRES